MERAFEDALSVGVENEGEKMKISFENDVRGRTVIDASGRSIGAVDAINLDGDSIPVGLRVASLRIKLHASVADSLGVSHGIFHPAIVEAPALALQAFGDAVVLNVDVGTLVGPTEAAPAP